MATGTAYKYHQPATLVHVGEKKDYHCICCPNLNNTDFTPESAAASANDTFNIAPTAYERMVAVKFGYHYPLQFPS
jgi:hypothetical protein